MDREEFEEFAETLKKWRDEMGIPRRGREETLQIVRTALKKHKKQKVKLALECTICILVVVAMIFIYDLVSSPWMAMAVIGCGGLFVYNEFLGYKYMPNMPPLLPSRRWFELENAQLKKLVLLNKVSMASIIVLGMLIPYWSPFGTGGIALWCFVVLVIVGVAWQASKPWRERAEELQEMLMGREDIENEAS